MPGKPSPDIQRQIADRIVAKLESKKLVLDGVPRRIGSLATQPHIASELLIDSIKDRAGEGRLTKGRKPYKQVEAARVALDESVCSD
jgi:hypothetical protein